MTKTALFLSSLISVIALSSSTYAQNWTLDKNASSITMITQVSSETVEGSFTDFDADIVLNPEDLTSARIDAVVQTNSGAIEKSDYQSAMVGRAGLHPEDHPEARFVSETIVKTDTGYEAQGTLTIKGHSEPATLPFTLEIEGDRAVAHGQLELQRSTFDVGASGWGSAAANIRLELHIEADRTE